MPTSSGSEEQSLAGGGAGLAGEPVGILASASASTEIASNIHTEQPAQGLPGMFSPFKVRNFTLLFGGQTVSTIGDALYAVALPWLILSNGGSPQEIGIVLAAYGIPRVGSILIGGWLSDRLRPYRLMLVADSVRAVLVGLLAVLALQGQPALWQLCAIAVPLGAFQGLFLPASSAILPDILSDRDLQAGNALGLIMTQLASLVGSSLAGAIVVALSSGFAMAIDALTFIISAASLALIRLKGESEAERALQAEAGNAQENSSHTLEQQANPQDTITLGQFVRTSRMLQVGLIVSLVSNFCFGGLIEVVLPTLVHGPMNGGAQGYGLIMAGFSIGALVGGILSGMLGGLKKKGLVALLVIFVMAAMIALLPYSGGVVGAIICMVISGIANSISNILLITVLQIIIPRHLMGRVMGLLMFTSFGTYPISVALAGVLTSQLGATILFPFSGLLLSLSILYGLSQKALRDL